MTDTRSYPESTDAVSLGYDLNEALGRYLDAKAIATDAGYEGYEVQAQSELLQIMWENKAGIIAHLLSGVAQRAGDCGAWQPIETAPRDGNRFLGWCVFPAGAEPRFVVWTMGGFYAYGCQQDVTHWLPGVDTPPLPSTGRATPNSPEQDPALTGLQSQSGINQSLSEGTPREGAPCSHATIIGLDGTWHCQKCGDAIDMAVALTSTHSQTAKD